VPLDAGDKFVDKKQGNLIKSGGFFVVQNYAGRRNTTMKKRESMSHEGFHYF
jgi:hypothetical protein